MQLRRRAFLASAATGVFAGCLGGGGASTDANDSASGVSNATDGSGAGTIDAGATGQNGSASTTRSGLAPTTESGSVPNLDHPSATDLGSQPVLGPALGEAPGIIVAFEDPSCHNCHRFNLNTFPKLKSKVIEPGKASFVYRNFPYAFPWGKPAMEALEATFSRSESAFWALESHYFETQGKFSESNVLERTKGFLASQTDLDATAVVEDARNKTFDGAVQTDIDAGDAANVVATPAFFLFKNQKFLTDIRGAQSYKVFAQALGA